MRRDVWALVLAGCLLFPAALALAEEGPGDSESARERAAGSASEGPGNATGNRSGERDRDADGPDEDERDDDDDRDLVHQFREADGTVAGDFVGFRVDRTLPGIRDYAVNGTPVLAAVALPDGTGLQVRTDGGHFAMGNNAGRLQVLGTPNALLLLKAERGNATITLARGITAAPVNSSMQDGDDGRGERGNASPEHATRAVWSLALPGNRTALLAGHDLTFDGADTFTASRGAMVQFRLEQPLTSHADKDDDRDERDDRGGHGERGERDDALQRHLATRALHEGQRARIEQALADGRISVEVFVDASTSEPLAVELAHVKVTKAEAHRGDVRARIEVEAEHGAPGTTVLLNLAADDLRSLTLAQIAERLAVRFDGKNVSAADDLDDVFDARDDGGEPEYLLLVGAERVQLLVTVPSFSVHSIEVVEVQSLGATLVEVATSPAVVAAGALAAVAVVGFTAWRRRGRK